MPKSQHVDCRFLNLIAYFMVADEDSASLPRAELVKPFTGPSHYRGPGDGKRLDQLIWDEIQIQDGLVCDTHPAYNTHNII
jgi:hypothetical protein